jgi:hypothetical protein
MNQAKSVNVWAFILTLGLLSTCLLSFGQSTLGSINGTVADQTGAMLPGAKVTLTNAGTGSKLQTVTSTAGIFNFRNLPVGTYNIRAEMGGFSIEEQSGLQLYANQAVTADLRLKVSRVQNSIEVTAASSLIDTQNSDLADVITGTQLLNTPLLTRQNAVGIYQDMYFAPGSQNPNSNNSADGNGNSSGTPSIDGARQLDSMITMDGMTVMSNIGDEGGTPVQPSYEAIQEMHTVMADAPAEFWRPAAVTVVTKSGTNHFHGSLFEDYNTAGLNTRNYYSSTVPKRIENNFAGSVGGPILKNKLFFFAAYEGGRNATDDSLSASMPLPEWTTGDFSSLAYQLKNPYAPGQTITGNNLANMPAGQGISKVSQYIQSVVYLPPNYGGVGLLTGNYRAMIQTRGSGWSAFDNGDASFQYNVGQKDTVFFHYNDREYPERTFTGSIPATGNYIAERVSGSGVIDENHIFSPTLINELRLGYTLMKLGTHGTFDGYDFLTSAGMEGPWTTTNNFLGTPSISISGVSGVPSVGNGMGKNEDNQWNDNLSWTRGRHLLKFGVDQIFDHVNETSESGTEYGGYSFNGTFTGNGYADFLLGLPNQTTLTSPVPISELKGTLAGIYGQDQFQISPRWTVNYGLRWEYQGPYSGAPYATYGFDLTTGAMVIQTQDCYSHISPYFPTNVPIETAARAGLNPNSFMNSHRLNLYPRAGFAYRLFPNAGTVLRGAIGVYGNNIYAFLGRGRTGLGGPFSGSASFINSFSAVPGHPLEAQPRFSFPDPFLPSYTMGTQFAATYDPNLNAPYTSQWNLSVEQKLGSNGVVTLAYVGSATRNLLQIVDLNQPPPSTTPFSLSEESYPVYSAVNWVENGGVDNYDSFQVSVRKSEGKNLLIDSGLSVTKDLTDAQDIGLSYALKPENRFCIGCDYGHNEITKRLTYYFNGNYVLPFGRGQRFLSSVNQTVDTVISGWGIAGDVSAMSGEFFSPYEWSFDTANTNTSVNQRPDIIGNPHVANQNANNWFNVNAFAIPGCPTTDPQCLLPTTVRADVGRFGDVKPGILNGPKFAQVDLSIMKNFRIANKGTFQLRLTAENAFNHPNFDIPDWYITDGAGVAGVLNDGLSGATVGGGGREVDLIGRFQF